LEIKSVLFPLLVERENPRPFFSSPRPISVFQRSSSRFFPSEFFFGARSRASPSPPQREVSLSCPGLSPEGGRNPPLPSLAWQVIVENWPLRLPLSQREFDVKEFLSFSSTRTSPPPDLFRVDQFSAARAVSFFSTPPYFDQTTLMPGCFFARAATALKGVFFPPFFPDVGVCSARAEKALYALFFASFRHALPQDARYAFSPPKFCLRSSKELDPERPIRRREPPWTPSSVRLRGISSFFFCHPKKKTREPAPPRTSRLFKSRLFFPSGRRTSKCWFPFFFFSGG